MSEKLQKNGHDIHKAMKNDQECASFWLQNIRTTVFEDFSQ